MSEQPIDLIHLRKEPRRTDRRVPESVLETLLEQAVDYSLEGVDDYEALTDERKAELAKVEADKLEELIQDWTNGEEIMSKDAILDAMNELHNAIQQCIDHDPEVLFEVGRFFGDGVVEHRSGYQGGVSISFKVDPYLMDDAERMAWEDATTNAVRDANSRARDSMKMVDALLEDTSLQDAGADEVMAKIQEYRRNRVK